MFVFVMITITSIDANVCLVHMQQHPPVPDLFFVRTYCCVLGDRVTNCPQKVVFIMFKMWSVGVAVDQLLHLLHTDNQ